MTAALQQSLWKPTEADRAVRSLARESGLQVTAAASSSSEDGVLAVPSARRARAAGLRLRRVEIPFSDLESLLRSAAPAILQLGDLDHPGLVALLGRKRRWVTLLGPDLVRRRVKIEELQSQLARKMESAIVGDIDDLIERTGIAAGRRRKARAHLLSQRLAGRVFSGCWTIEEDRAHSVARQFGRERLPELFCRLILAHLGQFLLWIAAWWTLGRAILTDSLSPGWMMAWTLLLLASIPARLLSSWYQGMLSIGIGRVSKTMLLRGSLRVDLDKTRDQGFGQLMARVVEAEAVETLSVSGGLISILAAIELAVALLLIPRTAGGWAHATLLLGWIGLIGAHGLLHGLRQANWTDDRLAMSEDLLEKMVGHRTRSAQERASGRHRSEDAMLGRYLFGFARLDRLRWLSRTVAPQGWLIASLLLLAPGFLSGASSPGSLAAGIGVTLLAMGAIQQLVAGQSQLIAAATAWRRARGLFRAAIQADPVPAWPAGAGPAGSSGSTELAAQDLVFRHGSSDRPVLDRCNLAIRSGDRIVLEGSSGSGKSTLVSVLNGLREALSGRVTIDGFDRETLGSEAWSRSVATVPQFHENHLFSATLAFNLLMGSCWPPTPEQLDEAEALCRELGLGELLDRMPSGLFQLVGETGWHLSHGERSRVYIARALLQKAKIVILDESFAALDPYNLAVALDCADRHADSLLVIAHP